MTLNSYLPIYDFIERHELTIRASPALIFHSLKSIDFNRSRIIRTLFRLRGLQRIASGRKGEEGRVVRLENFSRTGFILLAERTNEYIVLGLVGKFWTLNGGILRLNEKEFIDYHRPGYAKAIWGFELAGDGKEQSSLVTETRIQLMDEQSRRRFGIYWGVIAPFSGIIRKEMLRLVKVAAEGE